MGRIGYPGWNRLKRFRIFLRDLTETNSGPALVAAAKSFESQGNQADAIRYFRKAYFYSAGSDPAKEAEAKLLLAWTGFVAYQRGRGSGKKLISFSPQRTTRRPTKLMPIFAKLSCGGNLGGQFQTISNFRKSEENARSNVGI